MKMKIILFLLFVFLSVSANENDSLTLSNIRNIDSLVNIFVEIEQQDTIHFITEQFKGLKIKHQENVKQKFKETSKTCIIRDQFLNNGKTTIIFELEKSLSSPPIARLVIQRMNFDDAGLGYVYVLRWTGSDYIVKARQTVIIY